MEAHRGLADLFHQLEHLAALLVAHGVAEEAAEQADVGAQPRVVIGGGGVAVGCGLVHVRSKNSPIRSAAPAALRQRRHALDLDQHRGIRQRNNHAGGARRIRRRAERIGIEPVHGCDVGGARQQHVDLDEVAEVGAGLAQHALDVAHDVGELRLELLRQPALVRRSPGCPTRTGGRRSGPQTTGAAP